MRSLLSNDLCGPKKGRFFFLQLYNGRRYLLAACVLGDGLGALTDSVLGKFTRQEQTDSCLYLPTCDRGAFVVVSKSRSLCRNSFEDVIHKAVHYGHGLARNSGVRVNLFKHLVDVDAVRFLPLPLPFLVS